MVMYVGLVVCYDGCLVIWFGFLFGGLVWWWEMDLFWLCLYLNVDLLMVFVMYFVFMCQVDMIQLCVLEICDGEVMLFVGVIIELVGFLVEE